MRVPRLYQPSALTPGAELSLSENAARHAASVLRLRSGDALELFDGAGTAARAEIVRIARAEVVVRVGELAGDDREAPLAVTLALGIAKGERMDYSIQKSVELGAALLQPLTTERSVVRLDHARAERRLAHWQGVVVSACEQCGRNRLPRVAAPCSLDDWLHARASAAGVMPTPGAARGLADLVAPRGALDVLIGPEGGLSPHERRRAEAAGLTPVHLGPRVLRTETAAVAVLAAIMTLWGDLG